MIYPHNKKKNPSQNLINISNQINIKITNKIVY